VFLFLTIEKYKKCICILNYHDIKTHQNSVFDDFSQAIKTFVTSLSEIIDYFKILDRDFSQAMKYL